MHNFCNPNNSITEAFHKPPKHRPSSVMSYHCIKVCVVTACLTWPRISPQHGATTKAAVNDPHNKQRNSIKVSSSERCGFGLNTILVLYKFYYYYYFIKPTQFSQLLPTYWVRMYTLLEDLNSTN